MLPYITIHGIQIPSYGLCACIGIAAAVIFTFWNVEELNLKMHQILLIVGLGAVGLFAFAKLFYAIGKIPTTGFTVDSFLQHAIHGGIVFYGGLIGALLGAFVGCKIIGRSYREIMDYGIRAFPLFHGISRIGCLLNGCCYGVTCSWGVTTRRMEGLHFPVQLIESICIFVIFISMLVMNKVRGTRKYNIEFYLMTYAVVRFILEFFRGDVIRGIWPDGLSTSQHVAILMLVGCVISLVISFKKEKEDIGFVEKSTE